MRRPGQTVRRIGGRRPAEGQRGDDRDIETHTRDADALRRDVETTPTDAESRDPKGAARHRDRWNTSQEDECRRAVPVVGRRVSGARRWVREKGVVVHECRDL